MTAAEQQLWEIIISGEELIEEYGERDLTQCEVLSVAIEMRGYLDYLITGTNSMAKVIHASYPRGKVGRDN